jgi:Fe-S-cluster containining protein
MISKDSFVCDRSCGDCCKFLTVKLYKKDIETIKKEGYLEGDFVEYDNHIKSNVLKLIDSGCIFLGVKDGKYHCTIYNSRPKVCIKYPFVKDDKIESCKPVLLKYKFKK